VTPAKKADVLRHARRLIADSSAWTKGAAARNADGATCQPRDITATCFCSIGAVVRVVGDDYAAFAPLLRCLMPSEVQPFAAVQLFNDSHDTRHADVLRMFDEAIYRAEREMEAAPC
jgi:hypothetical protein